VTSLNQLMHEPSYTVYAPPSDVRSVDIDAMRGNPIEVTMLTTFRFTGLSDAADTGGGNAITRPFARHLWIQDFWQVERGTREFCIQTSHPGFIGREDGTAVMRPDGHLRVMQYRRSRGAPPQYMIDRLYGDNIQYPDAIPAAKVEENSFGASVRVSTDRTEALQFSIRSNPETRWEFVPPIAVNDTLDGVWSETYFWPRHVYNNGVALNETQMYTPASWLAGGAMDVLVVHATNVVKTRFGDDYRMADYRPAMRYRIDSGAKNDMWAYAFTTFYNDVHDDAKSVRKSTHPVVRDASWDAS